MPHPKFRSIFSVLSNVWSNIMNRARTKTDKTLIKISLLVSLFFFITSIIASIYSDRAIAEVNFLEEARQAGTVGASLAALETGTPWVQKHFAGESELNIWQSNLDYLREQPRQALLPLQIKQSISDNTKVIYREYNPGVFWMFVLGFSIFALFCCGGFTAMLVFPLDDLGEF